MGLGPEVDVRLFSADFYGDIRYSQAYTRTILRKLGIPVADDWIAPRISSHVKLLETHFRQSPYGLDTNLGMLLHILGCRLDIQRFRNPTDKAFTSFNVPRVIRVGESGAILAILEEAAHILGERVFGANTDLYVSELEGSFFAHWVDTRALRPDIKRQLRDKKWHDFLMQIEACEDFHLR